MVHVMCTFYNDVYLPVIRRGMSPLIWNPGVTLSMFNVSLFSRGSNRQNQTQSLKQAQILW